MSASTSFSSPMSLVVRLLQPFLTLVKILHTLILTIFTFRNQFSKKSSPCSVPQSHQAQGTNKNHNNDSLSETVMRLSRWFEGFVEWLEWVGRVGFIGVLVACAPVCWTIRWVGWMLGCIRWVLSGTWWESVRVWVGLVGVERILGQVSDAIGSFNGSGKRRRKTLVLDLDETLVHSRFKAGGRCDVRLEVMIDEFPTAFYVSKRPYLDVFLQTAAQWYNVVIFTASLKKYADPLINVLDPNGLVCGRYFRESCEKQAGNFVKDLRIVEPNLSDVLIVDNSPSAYAMHAANAVPIEAWYDDPGDEELLNLLPLLHAIAPLKDVRSLLALRLSGGVLAARSAYPRKRRGS